MSQFIVLDPDSAVIQRLQALASVYGYTCLHTQEQQHFEKLCQQKSFDGYVIVHQPYATSFPVELVHHPCIYCCQSQYAAEDFTRLKALGMDYILELPVTDEQLHALFTHLTNPISPPALPPELIEKYEASIPEKIATLQTWITQTPDEASILALKQAVHKIAGSAGAYGFNHAGQLCKAHELYLQHALPSLHQTDVQKNVVTTNLRFFYQLKLAFQHLELKEKQASAPTVATLSPLPLKSTEHQSSIVLVSTDLPFIQFFQTMAYQEHLEIEVWSSPEQFHNQWQGKQKAPLAVILDQNTQQDDDITKWAHDIRQPWSAHPPLIGIATTTDTLETRLRWLANGMELIIKKPITEQGAADILYYFISRYQSFPIKALIVDDDPDVGLLEKQTLESMGMQVCFLQDERKILTTLEEFDPDLLILDINLPNYNGKELLTALRADLSLKHLIIVIVTVHQEASFDNWAYTANCDEVLHKPLDTNLLQSRIANLLKRHASFNLSSHLDAITGLSHKDFFLSQLQDLFLYPSSTCYCFFVLAIDNWERLNLPSPIQKNILIALTHILKLRFPMQRNLGYLQQGSFGMILDHIDMSSLHNLIELLDLDIRKNIWMKGYETIKIQVSTAGSFFSTQDTNYENLIQTTFFFTP